MKKKRVGLPKIVGHGILYDDGRHTVFPKDRKGDWIDEPVHSCTTIREAEAAVQKLETRLRKAKP